jgi:drug/metabolite transporter (DMT)-like permease
MKRGLEVFSAWEVGSLRIAAASVFLLPIAVTQLRGLELRHYGKLLLSGLMGIFLPAFLFSLAQTRLASSVTGILNSLTPICTLLIGVIVFKQVFRRASLIGILIGLVGTCILIMTNSEGGFGGFHFFSFFVILACILYATNVNFIKYKITDLRALTITSVSLMLIGPPALLFLLTATSFVDKMQTVPGAWKALGFVLLLGFMSTSLATILFNKLVKISSPLFTSSVTYLIPVVAVLWGLLDGERLLLGHFIGMVAIILGVYLANRKT